MGLDGADRLAAGDDMPLRIDVPLRHDVPLRGDVPVRNDAIAGVDMTLCPPSRSHPRGCRGRPSTAAFLAPEARRVRRERASYRQDVAPSMSPRRRKHPNVCDGPAGTEPVRQAGGVTSSSTGRRGSAGECTVPIEVHRAAEDADIGSREAAMVTALTEVARTLWAELIGPLTRAQPRPAAGPACGGRLVADRRYRPPGGHVGADRRYRPPGERYPGARGRHGPPPRRRRDDPRSHPGLAAPSRCPATVRWPVCVPATCVIGDRPCSAAEGPGPPRRDPSQRQGCVPGRVCTRAMARAGAGRRLPRRVSASSGGRRARAKRA